MNALRSHVWDADRRTDRIFSPADLPNQQHHQSSITDDLVATRSIAGAGLSCHK